MRDSTTIKLIKDLDVTDLSGEKVMIDFQTGKYFLLKGVANDIWDYIQSPTTFGKIKQQLLDTYEVDETTCNDALIKFLEQLKTNQFIELV